MQASSDNDPTSLEEQAYRRLRQALVEGVFTPGQKLSIRRIAAALGTSPMPARTALRRLSAEQAVDVLPSGTAIVPRLTRAAFAELGAIRAELEPLAVRLAAPMIDRATHAAMTQIVRAGRAAREANNAEEVLRADRQFLFTLYRAAAAPMLLGIIEALWLRRGPHFWDARWVIVGRVPAANRHAEILDALRTKDGVRASAELKAEIESTTAYLLERMHFVDDPAVNSGLGGLQPLKKAARKPVASPGKRRGAPASV
ncbi:MAG TPA: GntR family transcriptional regulator [Roseomonas sp.]|jgi:DNA-binding GntR family transcriptional regulator